jgi:hypothetical protein
LAIPVKPLAFLICYTALTVELPNKPALVIDELPVATPTCVSTSVVPSKSILLVGFFSYISVVCVS